MDSPENSEEELGDCNDGVTTSHRSLFRSCFAVAFAFLIILLLSFSVMYLAVLIGNLSIWSPISVHSRCRIVSSGKQFVLLLFFVFFYWKIGFCHPVLLFVCVKRILTGLQLQLIYWWFFDNWGGTGVVYFLTFSELMLSRLHFSRVVAGHFCQESFWLFSQFVPLFNGSYHIVWDADFKADRGVI